MMLIPLAVFALFLGQASPPADPDDPGPPVVKRGGNAPRKKPAPAKGPNIITPLPVEVDAPTAPPAKADSSPNPAFDISASVPPRRPTENSLILRSREASAEYDSGLPNFICDQIVVRSRSEAKPPKWKQQDTVEVELMYADQKEDYRNVRINGKPLKSGTPEESGSWSTGDWGSTLIDILHPATQAEFKHRGRDKIAGVETEVFDFQVFKENSHWTIRFGKPIRPGYKGAIWIDPETARVLRTEMQAVKLPSDYEIDWVEQMTEYGWVTIQEQKYLLPLKSENIACFRYTSKCTRNEIEYKNYRKFATESTISTTQSEISFDEKPQPPAAPPKKID